MGKKAKARREANVDPFVVSGPEMRISPNYPLLALSGLGMILAGYLAWTSLGGEAVKGCGVGSACDVVLHSKWATLLGLPTALWGFLTYTLLAGIALIERRVHRHWKAAWIVSFFGIFYSAYLTTVSLTILNAACPYCLTSLGLMSAIFLVVTLQRPRTLEDFSWATWMARAAPAAGGLILLLHLNYTGVLGRPPEVEDPLAVALADHLSQRGVKFYGASWCPHCQAQKALFGVAARRLPYIECSPEGQGKPQSAECKAANIESYPTWVFPDNKRVAETLSLKQLADATGFKAPQSTAAP
jgi:uncharacterized membrane protein/thiol-disulfide isomerase/thioredoxin